MSQLICKVPLTIMIYFVANLMFLYQPGRRWLRQQSLGQERVQEVELVEGRGHPGQKSWILKLRGIDDVDQVSFL